MKVPKINGDRLWADLMALGEIGYADGRGVTRTALSEADLAGRAWLVRNFEEAGLIVTTDAACNVIGRLGCGTSGAGLVALGSHRVVNRHGLLRCAFGIEHPFPLLA